MMNLIKDDDPILKTVSQNWDFANDTDPNLLETEMIQFMQKNNGVGLAANQIGLLKRVLVIQLREHEIITDPFAMFNPQILEISDDTTLDKEGCLSFPNLWLTIKRAREVTVQYLDKNNLSCTIKLSNSDARCFLHELDHLNGVCFIDKISRLKLEMAKRKQRKYNG